MSPERGSKVKPPASTPTPTVGPIRNDTSQVILHRHVTILTSDIGLSLSDLSTFTSTSPPRVVHTVVVVYLLARRTYRSTHFRPLAPAFHRRVHCRVLHVGLKSRALRPGGLGRGGGAQNRGDRFAPSWRRGTRGGGVGAVSGTGGCVTLPRGVTRGRPHVDGSGGVGFARGGNSSREGGGKAYARTDAGGTLPNAGKIGSCEESVYAHTGNTHFLSAT